MAAYPDHVVNRYVIIVRIDDVLLNPVINAVVKGHDA